MYSAAIMKNHPSHQARFAPEMTAGVIAGSITCLTRSHPFKPKLSADSATLAGIERMAPRTPKKIAHAIDVKSRTITDNSMPSGPITNKEPITIGKYPSIGMDCSKSIIGVRISEAVLLVAANIPKETPHATDNSKVITIRETVLNV